MIQSFTTMNSLRSKFSLNHLEKIFKKPQNEMGRPKDQREYYKFDKHIKGTNITTKIKILRIKNIKMNCTITEFETFERLAITNEWTDEIMGNIYYDIIEEEKYKTSLTQNSYVKLRKEIMTILYPSAETVLYLKQINNVKQNNLSTSKIITMKL